MPRYTLTDASHRPRPSLLGHGWVNRIEGDAYKRNANTARCVLRVMQR